MKYSLIILLLFSAIKIKAQNKETNSHAIDFSFGVGKAGASPAIGYENLYGIGKAKKLKIGYGLRYTGYFAQDKDIHFRTAPAKLTSGRYSIFALFSDDILNQIDTLHMHNLSTNSFNINTRFEYSVTKRIDLGFNIDIIGFTFGKQQEALFSGEVSDSQGKANNGKTFNVKPAALNLLLISDSDIGSLNSEMYLRYWASPKVGIRAGASFQFIEYKSNQKVAFDNDRFRTKQLLPFIALTYKF